MVEIIDKDTKQKMMAMVICGIGYLEESYLLYGVRREVEQVNLFLSKLVKTSLGYVISSCFDNGEKEAMDLVVQRLLNCEKKEELERDGFSILRDIDLGVELYFDINKCYVSTVLKRVIKSCLIHYELVNEKMLKQPVVEVVEDNHKFSEGFASNILLIILGILVVIFCGLVIWKVWIG